MSQLNDAAVAYYRTQLIRTEGDLNELELSWLQSQGATSNDLNDAWDEFLILSGPFDSKSSWLSSLGYDGVINDALLDWYLA